MASQAEKKMDGWISDWIICEGTMAKVYPIEK
jgi:hypothetical protein